MPRAQRRRSTGFSTVKPEGWPKNWADAGTARTQAKVMAARMRRTEDSFYERPETRGGLPSSVVPWAEAPARPVGVLKDLFAIFRFGSRISEPAPPPARISLEGEGACRYASTFTPPGLLSQGCP